MRQSFRQVLAAALASLFALAAVGRAGADVRHTVSAGETLSYIAGLYGVAVDVLAGINHIANPDLIFPGQVLEIVGGQRDDGGPQNYQVRPGDTLTAISQRFGVSLAALMEANGLTDPDLIVAGETLIIPSPEVSDFVGFLQTRSWKRLSTRWRRWKALTPAWSAPWPGSRANGGKALSAPWAPWASCRSCRGPPPGWSPRSLATP